MNLNNLVTRFPLLISIALGAAMPLGFAPFRQFYLPPLLLAGLFLIWSQHNKSVARKSGFLFALAMNAVGTSWVFVSLNTFGEMPLLLALLCVSGFIAVLSVFPLFSAWLQASFKSDCYWLRLLVVMPVAWTIFEYARNHVLTGFSWLELGYSQSDTWIGGYASILGVHGVTFFTAIIAGAIVLLVNNFRHFKVAACLVLALVVGAGFAFANVPWSTPKGSVFSADLVQLNVPLSTKWSIKRSQELAHRYLDYSRASSNDADVVVWPESALPIFIDQLDTGIHEEIRELDRPLLAGFLERRLKPEGVEYFNTAVLFDENPAIYRKQHLVPFGEYTPLLWLFGPIADYFEVPMSEIRPWVGTQSNLIVAGRSIGVGICYEDAFPYDVLKTMPDAELLMNISEDAWFGDSLGPHQRLQMAQMRSREVARPMVRVSNTGLSAGIDHLGRLIAISPQFEEHLLNVEVQPRQGLTPYARWGDLPLLLALVFLSLGSYFWRVRKPSL